MHKKSLLGARKIVGALIVVAVSMSNVFATEVAVVEKTKLSTPNVTSLCMHKGKLYLNSENGVVALGEDAPVKGRAKVATVKGKKSVMSWGDKLCSIDEDLIIREVSTDQDEFEGEAVDNIMLDSDGMNEDLKKHFDGMSCADEKEIFVVIKKGWSSRIEAINPTTGVSRFITYISGDPAGVSVKDDTIWYISNSSNKEGKALVEAFGTETNATLKKSLKTPCKDVSGIAVNGDHIWTYSKGDQNLYKLEKSVKGAKND